MRGAPAKPLALKVLQGTDRKDRINPDQPTPIRPIGICPRDFQADERKAYKQIVKQCHEGVLSDADSIAVEIAAALLAEFRRDRRSFPANKLGRLEALLSRFGMTPSDRQKVCAVKKGAKDDWDAI